MTKTEVATLKRLQAELVDMKNSAKFVMSEDCPTDEIHCGCVPTLKSEVKRLHHIVIESANEGVEEREVAEDLKRERDEARVELAKHNNEGEGACPLCDVEAENDRLKAELQHYKDTMAVNRELMAENILLRNYGAKLEVALQSIRDMDYRGNRHSSADIARRALEEDK